MNIAEFPFRPDEAVTDLFQVFGGERDGFVGSYDECLMVCDREVSAHMRTKPAEEVDPGREWELQDRHPDGDVLFPWERQELSIHPYYGT